MNTAYRRALLASAFCSLLVLADLPTRMAPPGFSRVTLSIRDEAGKPTGVRLRVVNGGGEYFPPLGHLPAPDSSRRMSGDLILGSEGHSPKEVHAYVYDGAQIDLPPGKYVFHARRGFERDPLAKPVEISAAAGQRVDLRLTRFASFEQRGWYPGDTHMHFPDPAGIRYEMECEGLRVCSLLLLKSGYKTGRPGDGHFQNVEHFSGKLAPVSSNTHFIKTGEEFRHGLLAHLIFQNLKSIVWPVSTGGLREAGAGGFDWPLMLHATMDAHQQGALVTWAHWPYPSLEAPLDIALGQVDSLDLLTTGSPFGHHPILVDIYKMHGPAVYSMAPIEVYYGYLNCGFHLAASAGSDKMALNPPMGSARTYVKTAGPLNYDSWIEGIRAGRTFASTYPLLEFTVNGVEPGGTLRLPAGKARISVKARAQSIEPYDVLELMYNGSVLAHAEPSGEHNTAAIDRTFIVDKGGWLALRAHGKKMLPYGDTWWQQPVFAHTSPVYLEIPGTHPPSANAARLFLEQLAYLQRWIERDANLPDAASRREALGFIEKARAIYTRLL